MRLPDQLPLSLNIERALLGVGLPGSIPLHPPTAKRVLADPASATSFVRAWQAYEPQAEVEWATRRWAHLGQQRVPVRVHIGSWERVAELTGQAATLSLAGSALRHSWSFSRFRRACLVFGGPPHAPTPPGCPWMMRTSTACLVS
ncbi:DUF3322 domain-containing protein [Corynebacterium tuscaniense]|uniref:DUF3322 domain-containing protein n=1 Tax=Corynebacterium tuscaniense TaxID=302449 RepID=UPI000A0128DC